MAYRSRQKPPPSGSPVVHDDVAIEVAQEIARNFDLRTHQIEVTGKNVYMFFRKPCTIDLDELPKERSGFTFHYELSEPLVIPPQKAKESPPNG